MGSEGCPSPDLAKQSIPSFKYCTTLSANAGKIFIGKLVTEQVQADDSAKKEGSNVEDQLDKDDWDF